MELAFFKGTFGSLHFEGIGIYLAWNLTFHNITKLTNKPISNS